MIALQIRPAERRDAAHMLHCIRELARYERLEHQLDLDEERLAEHLFGRPPKAEALVAEDAGAGDSGSQGVVPVGFALFYGAYSTFKTRPSIYLEDLIVLPDHRGRGYGLALLRAVAKLAHERGCARLVWNVLDWNEPAIGFYEAQGAEVLPDWRTCQLSGDALARMASAALP